MAIAKVTIFSGEIGSQRKAIYQWQHEPILFGWKKKGRHQWYTGRKESTIWEFDKPKKNKDHPTMKPIPLLAYDRPSSAALPLRSTLRFRCG